jgi:GT2 family glycosyltransferase
VSAVDVSVVVPTHNGWPMLERTLRAALAQEGVRLEVVVVDDGSTDGTPEKVGEISDERVRLVRRMSASGPSVARNEGIAAARGPWVAFLDHDDVWAPHKLRTQLEAAARGDASWVYCAAIRVDPALRILRVDAPVVEPGELFPSLLSTNGIPGGASGPIVSADLLRAVGGFDPELRYMEDWDLWIRLAAAGSAAACQEPLLAYVVHPGSMLLEEAPDLDRELAHVASKHAELMTAADTRPNGVETYRWLAWSTWVAGHHLAALRTYVTGVRRHGALAHLRFAVAQALSGGVETVIRRPQRQRVEWLARMRGRA